MRLDSTLQFIPLGGQSMVAGAGVNIASAQVIDLLGSGVGTFPPVIIGNALGGFFGEDVGVGGGFVVPTLQVSVGTAFVTANSATLNVALQLAPDTGLAGSYLPGTWQTVEETGALTAAQLTANQIIARLDWAPAFPANLNPRYARLLFQIPAATNFTAGTISFAGVVPTRDDLAQKYAANNYKVA